MNNIWQPIDPFKNLDHMLQFEDELKAVVASGEAQKVAVKHKHALINRERWFRNLKTDEIWRLSPPDGPMKPYWAPVDFTWSGPSGFAVPVFSWESLSLLGKALCRLIKPSKK